MKVRTVTGYVRALRRTCGGPACAHLYSPVSRVFDPNHAAQACSQAGSDHVYEACPPDGLFGGSCDSLAASLAAAAAAQTYEALSKTCFSAGMADQVIASCSVVIGKRLVEDDDLATAYKNRGNAYDDKGDHASAIEDYARALVINPRDADAFNARGTNFTALGQYDRALLDFDQAIHFNPASPIPFGNRCFAKAVRGHIDDALADCTEALRLKHNDPGALAARAFVHLKARRADAAIVDYNAHLRLRPEDPWSLFGRGLARHLRHDQTGGDSDLAAGRALKADIDDDMAKLGLWLGDFR